MSERPPEENPRDELIEAYRRSSADDRSRPSEAVRASILARARLVATSRDQSAEVAFAPGRPAANDSRWHWKVAASLAAVGLAGLLAVQTLVTVPRGPIPTRPQITTESAPSAEVAPATVPSESAAAKAAPPTAAVANPGAQDQSRARAGQQANAPRQALQSPPMAAPVPESPVAAPALSGADASRSEAPSARLGSPISSMVAGAVPVPGARREQAIAALHATFPELFAAPAVPDTVRIAMVLNRDGTVYKIVREEPAAAGQSDAGLQLSQALAVRPEELETPAQFMTLGRTAAQPNTIVVALGVRRNPPSP